MEPWEFRVEAGAELDASGHGLVSVGARRGALSAELLTDTVDLRWAPEGDRGRGWLAARAELGAAGMYVSRWEDGARTPERDRLAFYEGVEAGALRWLPGGLYAGASGAGRWWHFAALPRSSGPIEPARPIGTLDAVVGWSRPAASAWVRAGVDATTIGVGVQPHVHLRGSTDLRGLFRPDLAVYAGIAEGQDDVTATRVGGLNPYTIPLAGANWAELWVEDYAVARAGLEVAPGVWTVGARADVAWLEGFQAGFLVDVAWRGSAWYADVAVGASPTVAREVGIPAAIWLHLGRDWR